MNIKEELSKFYLELTVLEDDLWVIRGIDDKLIKVIFWWDGEKPDYEEIFEWWYLNVLNAGGYYHYTKIISEILKVMGDYHK